MAVWIEKRWRVDFAEDGRQGSVTRDTHEAARAEERRLRATVGAHHVSKVPKGGNVFRVVWRDAAGKKRTKTFGGRGDGLDAAAARKAAEDYRAEVRDGMRRGSFTDPKRAEQAFATYWEGFLAGLEAEGRAPATLRLYEMLGRRYLLPTFGGLPLASIGPEDVRRWLGKLQSAGVGEATVNAAFRVLRRVLNRAIADGILVRNATFGIRAPSPGTEEMRFLEAEQVDRLGEAIEERYRALIYLLAYGGLRIGEAAALRVEDLYLPEDEELPGQVTIARALTEVGGVVRFGQPKTRQRRKVTIPPSLVTMLREHLARCAGAHDDEGRALVFASPEGAPLRPRNFRRRAWELALERAGLGEWEVGPDGSRRFRPGVRVHDLRHTHASLLIAQGAHVKAIADRLGHSSPTVTMRTYAHILPSLERQLTSGLEETFRAARGEAAPPPPPTEGGKVVLMAREQRRRRG